MKETNSQIKLLKPKYDIVFQALFQGNKENITQSFISDIIGEQIEIVDIKTDNTILKEYPMEKAGRLDLITKFKDGTICQIEMQMANEYNTIKRILYYWSKTYSKQIKRGEPYKKLKKTIGIIITNYEVNELKGIEKLDTKWQIMNTKEPHKVLTDDLEIHIIEIPKAKKILEKEGNNRIAQWITFIDNPNTERAKKIMKENEEVKKANNVLHEMSEDEKLQRLAELREKWERDEISAREAYKEHGLAEGRAEGLKQGLVEGRKEGRREGRKQGIEESKIEIAKKLKSMKMKIEDIQKATGLKKEEIEKL